jgi:hypothetical protein
MKSTIFVLMLSDTDHRAVVLTQAHLRGMLTMASLCPTTSEDISLIQACQTNILSSSKMDALIHLFHRHVIPSLRLLHDRRVLQRDYALNYPLSSMQLHPTFTISCTFTNVSQLVEVCRRLIAGELISFHDIPDCFQYYVSGFSQPTQTDVKVEETISIHPALRSPDRLCMFSVSYVDADDGVAKERLARWFVNDEPCQAHMWDCAADEVQAVELPDMVPLEAELYTDFCADVGNMMHP